MIKVCPFCGHKLKQIISEGITTCSNCERVFDSCTTNKILSASWMIRKYHFNIDDLNLKSNEKETINKCIVEQGLSHDEFIDFLTKV